MCHWWTFEELWSQILLGLCILSFFVHTIIFPVFLISKKKVVFKVIVIYLLNIFFLLS